MCPVPLNSARAFVALGSRVVEGTKIRLLSRAATMDLMLTVVGVEPKERESPVELFFFIMDATWPQGAVAVRWNRIPSSLPKFLQDWNKSSGKGRTGKKKVVEYIRPHVTCIELCVTSWQSQAVSGSENVRARVLSLRVRWNKFWYFVSVYEISAWTCFYSSKTFV